MKQRQSRATVLAKLNRLSFATIIKADPVIGTKNFLINVSISATKIKLNLLLFIEGHPKLLQNNVLDMDFKSIKIELY